MEQVEITDREEILRYYHVSREHNSYYIRHDEDKSILETMICMGKAFWSGNQIIIYNLTDKKYFMAETHIGVRGMVRGRLEWIRGDYQFISARNSQPPQRIEILNIHEVLLPLDFEPTEEEIRISQPKENKLEIIIRGRPNGGRIGLMALIHQHLFNGKEIENIRRIPTFDHPEVSPAYEEMRDVRNLMPIVDHLKDSRIILKNEQMPRNWNPEEMAVKLVWFKESGKYYASTTIPWNPDWGMHMRNKYETLMNAQTEINCDSREFYLQFELINQPDSDSTFFWGLLKPNE